MLKAVEGHTECVEVLIQAGANPNVLDNSGWNPHIHAVFRGHSHSAVKDILRPLTIFEEHNPSATISPKSKSKLNASAFAYGHKYLRDQSMIIVTLGNTDTRKCVNPVELYNTQISSLSVVPSTSISLVVDAKNVTGEPVIVDLPVNTLAIDPIIFTSSNIDDVIMMFDIIPTHSTYSVYSTSRTKKQLIGRATVLLSSVKTSSGPHSNSLIGSVTVPILGVNTLEVIGRVVFEFLVIKTFKHENLAVDSKRTYWKSVTTKVIGHRGLGMNRAETPGCLQLGENTLISFITAASLGAEYIEFGKQNHLYDLI
jgi:glycerophosphodiester phosphodiesterase